MKTNFSRFGRSAVSVVLSAIMLLSTVIVNAETINVDSVSEAAASDTVTVDITPDDVTQTVMDVEDVRANSEDDSAAAESVKNDEEESQPDAAEVKTEDVKADTAVQANSKKSEVKKTPEASGANAGDTIYFIDNLKWGQVTIHPFNSSGSTDATMTKVTGTSNLYYYTLTGSYSGVIFLKTEGVWNDRYSVSENITIGSNNVFYLTNTASGTDNRRKGTGSTFSDLGITDTSGIEAGNVNSSTRTINFHAIDYGWSNCYIHYWVETSDGIGIGLSTWPGVEMSGSNDVYSANIPSIANKAIFLRKKSDGKAKYRTGNVTLSNDVNKTVFFPENSNFLDGNTENKVTNGYWMSEDEYTQSLNATKTVYVDTSASWNVNTAAAYYGKPDGSWHAISPTTATDNEEISTITIEGGYDKVIFTKNTNWGSGGNENKTFAVPLVGHDSNMCFYVTDTVSNDLLKEDNETNLTATRTGYWGKPAQYWPDTADLVGTGTDADTAAYMYWSNSDDGFAKSENNGSYSDTPNKKRVQQIKDTSGNTWYYVDFTNAEVRSNLYFGLADSSGTPLNNTNGIKVSLSNSFVLGYGVQEKNQFWFGKTWTLKRVETLRIYVNSLDSSFYRYSIVPVSSVTGNSVNVIAKDGTLRNNFKKYADLGDTKIVEIGGDSAITNVSSGTYKIGSTYIYDDYPYNNHNYAQTAVIDKGTTIKIRTTIASGDPNKEDENHESLVEKYYVKAFNINGETVWPTTKGVQSSGVYECEYTIPSSYKGENIEITPVYYYSESPNSSRKYINFIVENFNGAVVDEWGRKVNNSAGTPILACYAWYGHGNDEVLSNATNKPALGGYPGQPMVYENGHYTMQVPVTIDDGSHIQGITLNNYVWDFVHADTQGAGNDGQRESINCQTYDYDDFVVLSYANPAPEFIAFRFKYETTNNQNTGVVTTTRTSGNTPQPYGNLPTDSDLDYSSYTEASGGNGWETPYEDYYGNTIDLFNNILKKKDGTVVKTEYEESFKDKPFYVVSDGYRDIYYGHFTTLWYVYDSNKKFVGKIPSSALYYEPTSDEPMPTTLATNVEGIPSWFLPWRDKTTYNITDDRQETNNDEKLEYWTTYYYLYWGGKKVGSSTTVSALNHTAEITYETAIRAQDTNKKAPGNGADKHPRDPGLRNDGQWYHSKSGVTFDAEIVIKYWDTTLNDGEGGWATDKISASGDNPRAGTVTGAHAYFTNKTYTPTGGTTINFPGYLQYTAAGVQTSSDSFQFEANQYSQGVVTSGSTTKQMYKFDGWYVEIDGVESPLTTVLNDDKAMSSTADMRGYTKLVAKYKPYDETIIPSGEYLEISHNLYKDAVKFANSPAVLNGTGTPKITVQVFDGNTEIDNIPYIVDNATNTVKVDKAYLEAYKNATLKVTLKTEPDSNNTYENTYLKTVDENTAAGATGVKGYEEPAVNGTATYPTGAAWTVESKATNPETNVGTIVYTTTISDLLTTTTSGETTNTTLKTNNIKFYTQLSTTTINVVLKYYDRKVSNSTPLDIDTKATEITKTVSVKDNLKDAVGTATTDLISNKKIDNDIDEYKFWASLSDASGENGIADLTRPNGDSKYEESIYHTDYYARQPGEGNFDNKDQAKWVTYLDANGVEIKTAEFNEDTDTVATYAETYDENAQKNIKRVSKVVVWGYNAPKTYQMTFYTDTTQWDEKTINGQTIYLAQGNGNFANTTYYYNERVGERKDSTKTDDKTLLVDQVSKHLAAYGISQKSDDATKVYADTEVTVSDSKKVFDGWYELVNGSYVKVSSDPVYGNRVTKSAKLYAGYKDAPNDEENATVNKGITVTANDVEKYVVGDTDYIRYTTVLNSYGFDDSDPNFKSASVVYVRLDKNVNYSDTVDTLLGYNVSNGSGTLKQTIIDQLKEDKSTERKVIAVTITGLDPNAKTVIYSYDVYPTYTDGKVSTPTPGSIQFTNKNRTQFSMNLPVSEVTGESGSCTNLVVFAAVKYEDSTVYQTKEAIPYNYFDLDQQSTTTTDPDTGESVTTTTTRYYIASDNYIIYQNGAAVNNNN